MKYQISAVLKFNDKAKRGMERSGVLDRIGSRPRWKLGEGEGPDHEDPSISAWHIQCWFDEKADCDEIFAEINSRMAGPEYLPGSSLTTHACTHDEDPPQPCVISTEYIKQRGGRP